MTMGLARVPETKGDINVMKQWALVTVVLLAAAAAPIHATPSRNTLVVTSSNNAAGNSLLAFDSTGALVQTIATGGMGGVSGNAGGIAAAGQLVAVVNFGSQSVSVFELTRAGFALADLITTISPPVSVAFGHGHLYVLGTTSVESHQLYGRNVAAASDGATTLLRADGSAARRSR
jgi:DNA-binding beta-propeller fold protein YncE